jgi:hypothetical protein
MLAEAIQNLLIMNHQSLVYNVCASPPTTVVGRKQPLTKGGLPNADGEMSPKCEVIYSAQDQLSAH